MTTPIVPAPTPSPERDQREALLRAIRTGHDAWVDSPTAEVNGQAPYLADAILAAGFRRGPGWIACSNRLPRLTADTGMGRLRSAAVLCLFPDDGNTHPGLDVRPAYYLQYDDWGEWYEPCDASGGLDCCTSHGSPAPTHWTPMPKHKPAPDNTDKARAEAGEGEA